MSDTAIAAPVSTPAPTAAAPAPVERNFNQMIAKVAQQTTVAEAAAPEQPVVKFVPNAPPKAEAPPSTDLPPGTTPPETTAAPDAPDAGAEVEATDAPPAEAAPEPVAVEAVGEIVSEEDGLTLSSERNADGTFKSKTLDPTQKFDFAIKDKGTGETRTYSKTIPELMRMAKDGIEGQKVRSEVAYYRENVPKWTQQVETLEQQLADQQALNRELLTAPDDLVIRRREEYASEMSPEKIAARENAELRKKVEAIEAQTKRSQLAARSQSFLTTRGLAAVIANAEAKLGAEIVAGKLAMATAPLTVNGVIPEQYWPALEAHIKGPFSQWVAAEITKKDTQHRQASLDKQATEKARRDAQAAVNGSTRTMVPVGRAAPDAPPEPPKPKNAQEAISRMVNRPLPSTVAGV